MRDKELALNIIATIEEVLHTILNRTVSITSVDDFLKSETGMILLDSVCIKLMAVGESIKNLDKVTEKRLLSTYQHINWRDIMGMRDIIVHHYFDIDADVIFKTLQDDIPQLLTALHELRKTLLSR